MTITSTPGSVTALVERVKVGDHEAVRLLWQRYYPRLVGLVGIVRRDQPRSPRDRPFIGHEGSDEIRPNFQREHPIFSAGALIA
ncbi:MAG TPA: hypothetical protein VKD72_00405 [Gemmataceae bacterium]|nr:hypothetical protein [Gemmataceae bacterium]